MPTVYFISHPEVALDPAVPITEWDLAPIGRARLARLLQQPWLPEIGAVWSSEERKALTAARAIAAARGLGVNTLPALGEIDRSATGYLTSDVYEAVTEAFFAAPERSARGWERAADAQARIVAAAERVRRESPAGCAIAVVAHGGVGALLLSHLKGVPISRRDDQPGQGHYFAFGRETLVLHHGWRPIDRLPDAG